MGLANYEGVFGSNHLAAGAADIESQKVETPETIATLITRYGWLAPEQMLMTSSCGMDHLQRQIAFGKLRAMAGAKRQLST